MSKPLTSKICLYSESQRMIIRVNKSIAGILIANGGWKHTTKSRLASLLKKEARIMRNTEFLNKTSEEIAKRSFNVKERNKQILYLFRKDTKYKTEKLHDEIDPATMKPKVSSGYVVVPSFQRFLVSI